MLKFLGKSPLRLIVAILFMVVALPSQKALAAENEEQGNILNVKDFAENPGRENTWSFLESAKYLAENHADAAKKDFDTYKFQAKNIIQLLSPRFLKALHQDPNDWIYLKKITNDTLWEKTDFPIDSGFFNLFRKYDFQGNQDFITAFRPVIISQIKKMAAKLTPGTRDQILEILTNLVQAFGPEIIRESKSRILKAAFPKPEEESDSYIYLLGSLDQNLTPDDLTIDAEMVKSLIVSKDFFNVDASLFLCLKENAPAILTKPGNSGITPLHILALTYSRGQEEFAGYLRDLENADVKDMYGKTPFQLANREQVVDTISKGLNFNLAMWGNIAKHPYTKFMEENLGRSLLGIASRAESTADETSEVFFQRANLKQRTETDRKRITNSAKGYWNSYFETLQTVNPTLAVDERPLRLRVMDAIAQSDIPPNKKGKSLGCMIAKGGMFEMNFDKKQQDLSYAEVTAMLNGIDAYVHNAIQEKLKLYKEKYSALLQQLHDEKDSAKHLDIKQQWIRNERLQGLDADRLSEHDYLGKAQKFVVREGINIVDNLLIDYPDQLSPENLRRLRNHQMTCAVLALNQFYTVYDPAQGPMGPIWKIEDDYYLKRKANEFEKDGIKIDAQIRLERIRLLSEQKKWDEGIED